MMTRRKLSADLLAAARFLLTDGGEMSCEDAIRIGARLRILGETLKAVGG